MSSVAPILMLRLATRAGVAGVAASGAGYSRDAAVTDCRRLEVAADSPWAGKSLGSLGVIYMHTYTYITCQSNFIFTPQQIGSGGLQ